MNATTEAETVFQMVEKVDGMAGVHMEQLLFRLADQQVEGYMGGCWESEEIVPGLLYAVVPVSKEGDKVHITSPNNFCDVTTDPKSAGMALTLIAINYTLWLFHDRGYLDVSQKLTELFYKLREAALESDELDVAAIVQIID